MKTLENIPVWVWKIALAAAAVIWGGSFVVVKGALDAIAPNMLMAIRFCATALILCVLFRRTLAQHLDRDHLRAGLWLGLASGGAFIVQNLGLVMTTPGKNAFLTATYCVMVPFLVWATTRKAPGIASIFAALLTVAGVGLVSLEGGVFVIGPGEALTLLCALLFAIHIVLVSHYSARGLDVMAMTLLQIVTSAVLCVACALLSGEQMPAPEVLLEPQTLGSLAYMVLLSSCLCMVLQNLGQANVPPAQASLILSLESVFAVIASVLFYGEPITLHLLAGFSSIFVAVVMSELGEARA